MLTPKMEWLMSKKRAVLLEFENIELMVSFSDLLAAHNERKQ